MRYPDQKLVLGTISSKWLFPAMSILQTSLAKFSQLGSTLIIITPILRFGNANSWPAKIVILYEIHPY